MNPKRNLKGVSRLGLLAVILTISVALATPEQVLESDRNGKAFYLELADSRDTYAADTFYKSGSDNEVDAWIQVCGAAVGPMMTPTPTSRRREGVQPHRQSNQPLQLQRPN